MYLLFKKCIFFFPASHVSLLEGIPILDHSSHPWFPSVPFARIIRIKELHPWSTIFFTHGIHVGKPFKSIDESEKKIVVFTGVHFINEKFCWNKTIHMIDIIEWFIFYSFSLKLLRIVSQLSVLKPSSDFSGSTLIYWGIKFDKIWRYDFSQKPPIAGALCKPQNVIQSIIPLEGIFVRFPMSIDVSDIDWYQ